MCSSDLHGELRGGHGMLGEGLCPPHGADPRQRSSGEHRSARRRRFPAPKIWAKGQAGAHGHGDSKGTKRGGGDGLRWPH